jgi:hypothetical protein
MNRLEFKNLEAVSLAEIPRVSPGEFRRALVEGAAAGRRVVLYFGDRDPDAVSLYAVQADDDLSRLTVVSTVFRGGETYPSITPEVPAFHL